MRISADLRALCADPAMQRQTQDNIAQVKREWLASQPMRDLGEELARYSAGADLCDCPALARIFKQSGAAQALIGGLVAALIPAIRANPLAHIPFPHQYADGFAVIQLAEQGKTRLSLMLLEGERLHRRPETKSLCFPDCERHEVVLAGEARANIVRRSGPDQGPAKLEFQPLRLAEGAMLSLGGPHETRMMAHIESHIISLRLTRIPDRPQPSREFLLSDGTLIHQSSGDIGESRMELAMALLGKMGRQDAAPALAMRSQSGSDNFRWQALRECLALDTAEGFRALTRVAQDPQDSLAAPAGALRAQLLESYPQLETIPCPA